MNKTILLSAVAAAALLAGCRTTQTNHVRRGLLSTGETETGPRAGSRVRPIAPKTDARATQAEEPVVAPVAETPLAPAVETPVVPAPTRPEPVTVEAPPRRAQSAPVPMWTVPVAGETAPAAVPAPAQQVPAAGEAFENYVVKSGDVAGRIANSHGMTLKEFCEANGFTFEQAGKLRVGQVVKVRSGAAPLAAGPAVRPVAPAVSSDPDVYVVQPGDTLSGISAKSGVPVATLAALNGIGDPDEIRAGRSLRLKAKAGQGGSSATVDPAEPVVRPVVPPTTQPPRVVPPTTQPPRVVPPTTQPVRVAPTTTQPVRIAPPPTTQPQQDASVPLDRVPVAETGFSVQDILNDGMSLTEAREAAAEKAEAADKAVREALETDTRAAGDAPAGYRYYIVQEGENLYTLSARYHANVVELRKLNGMAASASKLEPGTRLLVPDTAAVAP